MICAPEGLGNIELYENRVRNMSVPNTAFWRESASEGANIAPERPGSLIDQVEVHVGVVNGLQVVVHGLGLGQGGHRLLHQGGGDLPGKAQAGTAVAQDLVLRGGVQPDAAVGLAGEGKRGGGAEESQAQLRDQQGASRSGAMGSGQATVSQPAAAAPARRWISSS